MSGAVKNHCSFRPHEIITCIFFLRLPLSTHIQSLQPSDCVLHIETAGPLRSFLDLLGVSGDESVGTVLFVSLRLRRNESKRTVPTDSQKRTAAVRQSFSPYLNLHY